MNNQFTKTITFCHSSSHESFVKMIYAASSKNRLLVRLEVLVRRYLAHLPITGLQLQRLLATHSSSDMIRGQLNMVGDVCHLSSHRRFVK
jgi:hypothetical protein